MTETVKWSENNDPGAWRPEQAIAYNYKDDPELSHLTEQLVMRALALGIAILKRANELKEYSEPDEPE